MVLSCALMWFLIAGSSVSSARISRSRPLNVLFQRGECCGNSIKPAKAEILKRSTASSTFPSWTIPGRRLASTTAGECGCRLTSFCNTYGNSRVPSRQEEAKLVQVLSPQLQRSSSVGAVQQATHDADCFWWACDWKPESRPARKASWSTPQIRRFTASGKPAGVRTTRLRQALTLRYLPSDSPAVSNPIMGLGRGLGLLDSVEAADKRLSRLPTRCLPGLRWSALKKWSLTSPG